MITIEDLAKFCKKKGFVYQNSEIYGGLSGVWGRGDVVGMDGSIITNPKVWEASGHVEGFTDALLDCSKCSHRVRADQFIEEKLKMDVAGLSLDKINEIIHHHKLKCPKCNSDFRPAKGFNLMFKTNVGPVEGSIAYLRPETAQLIFADFKLVQDNARLKLPFGIAQIGRVFRNEIAPRDFIFRCREFEQMEIEYFINPEKKKCPYIGEVLEHELFVYTAEMQEKKLLPKNMKVSEILDKGIMSEWHAYWLSFEHNWFISLGANADNFRMRQHLDEEKSHYATDTWDLEYKFPFGWKELQGIANRSNFDLSQHMKLSKEDLSYFDEESKKKFIPHVVCEPSLGVERTFLVFLLDAYEDDKKRGNVVLKLHPKLAPYKAAVFPLLSNKPELVGKAKEVYALLRKEFNCFFDASGSVGRRYARADENGTFLCCTIDFQSLEDDTVTLRHRDTTQQIRIKIKDIVDAVAKLINGEDLERFGEIVK